MKQTINFDTQNFDLTSASYIAPKYVKLHVMV